MRTAEGDGPEIICVLGAPRSGTSLAAGVLERLGVHLGHDEDMVQGPGSWEHRFFWEVNRNLILGHLGQNWISSSLVLPTGWTDAPELVAVKGRTRAAIDSGFGAAPIWGWKDPLTSLTLPFWKSFLPTMKYVVCVRDPVEVAASASEKFSITFEQGLYMWLRFLISALEHTEGDERLLIFYEEWFGDDSDQLENMAQLLDKPQPTDSSDLRRAVETSIDVNLWTHRSRIPVSDSESGMALRRDLVRVVQPAYERLRSGRRFDRATADQLRAASTTVGESVRLASYETWSRELGIARRELTNLIPTGEIFVLVDDGTFPAASFPTWHVLPFLERAGHYWGSPADSVTAIFELGRMRDLGASFAVFGWPAFWWLEHYPDFHDHLRVTADCVFSNRRLIVFDFRSSS